MTIEEIQKKLNNMTKSQLESVCRKIKCPQGTKKQMIVNLLRPFTMNKYGMWSSDYRKIIASNARKEADQCRSRKIDAKRLMEEHGTWLEKTYGTAPDNQIYAGYVKSPCCSKCKEPDPWWGDTLFPKDKSHRCSPCKKSEDGYRYVIDTESAKKLCTLPQTHKGKIV